MTVRTSPAPDPCPAVLPTVAPSPTARRAAGATSDVPAAPLALSAVALGCALQVNFGQYDPLALAWVTVALGLLALCLAKPSARAVTFLQSHQPWVLALALAVQVGLLFARSPGATGSLAGEAHLGVFRSGL